MTSGSKKSGLLSVVVLPGSVFVLSHLPTFSSFNPLPNGAKKWQQEEHRLEDYFKPLHPLPTHSIAGYLFGQKTEGLELQTVPRFLLPESDQTAPALPTQRVLLGD